MKILFDTNIVLDVLLNREPFAIDAIKLFNAVESKDITGFLCAKQIGKNATRKTIISLLKLFSIAKVNQKVLINAANSPFSNFEDAVFYQAGVYVDVDGLVTRNIKDFNLAEYPIYMPNKLCEIITI